MGLCSIWSILRFSLLNNVVPLLSLVKSIPKMVVTVTFRWYLAVLSSPLEKGQIKSLDTTTTPPPPPPPNSSCKRRCGDENDSNNKREATAREIEGMLIGCFAEDCSLIVQCVLKAFVSFPKHLAKNQLCVFLTESTQTWPDGCCWEPHPQPGIACAARLGFYSSSSQMLMRAHIGGGHILWTFERTWRCVDIYIGDIAFFGMILPPPDLWSLKVDHIEWVFSRLLQPYQLTTVRYQREKSRNTAAITAQ